MEDYEKLMNYVEDESPDAEVQDIKNFLTGKEKKHETLFIYLQILIDRMKSQNRIGTAPIYAELLVDLKRYRINKDIRLNKITYRSIVDYDSYLIARGNSVNTRSIKMRTLRATINFSIKEGLAPKDKYPFENFKIKTEKTKKRAVNLDVLKRINEAEFDQESRCYMARQYFLISFHLIGMNFSDMAYLKVSNFIGGRVEYVRRKTKKQFSIKINDSLSSLLKPYFKLKGRQEYFFQSYILLELLKMSTSE